MAKLLDRAGMSTTTTGTGTITLGSALSDFGDGASAQSFATAGVITGDVVNYLIIDGTAWELGYGTYTTSGTTLSRTLRSSSTGALLNLSGSAKVYSAATSGDFVRPIRNRSGDASLYHTPLTAGAASITTVTANVLYAIPLSVYRLQALTKIGLRVGTAAAGNARIGLYADSKNGQPGALIVDSGSFSVNTAAVIETTISKTVDVGTYWLTIVTSINTSTYNVGATIISLLGHSISQGPIAMLSRALTFAALPADESSQTYALDTNPPFLLWVR